MVSNRSRRVNDILLPGIDGEWAIVRRIQQAIVVVIRVTSVAQRVAVCIFLSGVRDARAIIDRVLYQVAVDIGTLRKDDEAITVCYRNIR